MTDRPSDRAFDLGFEWRQMLQGHVYDGRDVGRTLTAPQFEAMGVDPSVVDAMDSKDLAIVKAKAEIKRALAAAAPDGAQAVAMPDPVGWCRVKNGQYQVQIGGVRPHDRGNGDHSPWANLYDSPALRAYGKACAGAVRSAPPSQDAEDAARYRWLRDTAGNEILEELKALFDTGQFDAAIDAARAARGGG